MLFIINIYILNTLLRIFNEYVLNLMYIYATLLEDLITDNSIKLFSNKLINGTIIKKWEK